MQLQPVELVSEQEVAGVLAISLSELQRRLRAFRIPTVMGLMTRASFDRLWREKIQRS